MEQYNTYAKVIPPLRTEADTKAIIEGLADGTIDVIASGHMPTRIEHKQREFDRASYGISAFEIRRNQELYRRPSLSNPEAQHSGILGIDR